MITLRFNEIEFYDEESGEFKLFPSKTVSFEYSLLAISKWESKWKTPFLSSQRPEGDEDYTDFYLCMSLTGDLSKEYITDAASTVLAKYILDTQTATRFRSQNGNKSAVAGKVYTSEEIYALMFMNHIPLEFEERNLNRLLNVLRIISVYSSPPEKMSNQDIIRQNIDLNEERKRKYKTEG